MFSFFQRQMMFFSTEDQQGSPSSNVAAEEGKDSKVETKESTDGNKESKGCNLDILTRISRRIYGDIMNLAKDDSVDSIKAKAGKEEQVHPTRPFGHVLQKVTADKKVGLIAEVKHTSPTQKKNFPESPYFSKNYDPAEIAASYEKAGATCISVITEEHEFGGNIDDIAKVKEKTTLPILRKDFIFSEWQVAQSRMKGADCILLIMALFDGKNEGEAIPFLELEGDDADKKAERLKLLGDGKIEKLVALAKALNMDVLIETHNEEELKRAISLDTFLIGINNRDLKTDNIDLNTTIKLATEIPPDKLIVSESGIKNHDDYTMLKKAGVNAILVGSSLLSSKDPEQAVKDLLGNET